MDNISNDIIIYELNNYLDINNKSKLRLVNKKFNKLVSKTINFHIGTLIANFLGFNYNCNRDQKILSKYKFEFLLDISNYLLNNLDIKKNKKNKSYNIFPIIILLKINSSCLNECKIKLKQPNIFRPYNLNKSPRYFRNIFNKINYYNNRCFLKYFPNVYAII